MNTQVGESKCIYKDIVENEPDEWRNGVTLGSASMGRVRVSEAKCSENRNTTMSENSFKYIYNFSGYV